MCNLFCVLVTKKSEAITITALPIRVAKNEMQRNVPNYLFQVEDLHQHFIAQGKLCIQFDAQMLHGKCIQMM